METRCRDRWIAPLGPKAQQAIPSTPTTALYHCELGKLHLEARRYTQALTQFEQALTVDPHDIESWYGRADALACLNCYDEALASLEQARELADSPDPRFWIQKAVLLLLVNRPAAALTCCNQALWLAPNHIQAWLFRGVALERLGHSQAACRSYQRANQPNRSATVNAVRRLCHDLALTPQAS